MEKETRIHPSAWVDEKAQIGKGTAIWQNCNIMKNVIVGNNCNIGANVFLESGVKLGNNVKVKNNIAIYTGVECEDDVFLGPNCVFTNVINPRAFIERKMEFRPTLVKKGATIGANATILCGHTIGRYSMVGAGSVVTKDVKDYELVIGNPAKHLGFVCKCGVRLKDTCGQKLFCPECNNRYKVLDEERVLEVKEEG